MEEKKTNVVWISFRYNIYTVPMLEGFNLMHWYRAAWQQQNPLNEQDLYIYLWKQQLFLSYVKCLSVCSQLSVNTKRCHENVTICWRFLQERDVLAMHRNFHPLNSQCLRLTATIRLNNRGGNQIRSPDCNHRFFSHVDLRMLLSISIYLIQCIYDSGPW